MAILVGKAPLLDCWRGLEGEMLKIIVILGRDLFFHQNILLI